jgi:hypothetical protein
VQTDGASTPTPLKLNKEYYEVRFRLGNVRLGYVRLG